MFTDVVSAGTKALGGARFSLVSILPGTLFAALVLLAALSGAYGPGEADLTRLTAEAERWGPGGAVLLVFGLFLAGVLLQPFQVALVQYLEGYWDRRPTRALSAIAVERHRRRMRTASIEQDTEAPEFTGTDLRTGGNVARAQALAARQKAQAEARLRGYPVSIARVMPTMLGNILRSGEDAAGARYGLGALTVYPRMYPSISKPLSEAMSRQLDMIVLTASLTVSNLAATVALSPVLFVRRDLWVLLPVGTVLLAVVSYRGALRAAAGHGVLFATTFDLHRFDMIRALHLDLPPTFAEEISLNRSLTAFLHGRKPTPGGLADRPYDHSIYDQPTPLVQQVPTETGGGGSGAEGGGGSTESPPDAPAAPPPPETPPR